MTFLDSASRPEEPTHLSREAYSKVSVAQLYGERMGHTLECPACRATYPRQASPGGCVWCGYDRTVGSVDPIPHEYERFTR